jgi:hypothetical protein
MDLEDVGYISETKKMVFADLVEYLGAAKTALDILKGIQSELPKSEQSDKAHEQIAKAETSLQLSQAELAKALGYKLCRCAFPPPIMLWKKDQRVHVCPDCGDHYPHRPEVNRAETSWVRSRSGR